MKSISRRALALYLLIIVFLLGSFLTYYNLAVNANNWAMNRANRHLYTDGGLATAGDITDRNGVILATTTDGVRTYNDDKTVRMSTLQTVGDGSGYIACGIQTAFKDELTGYTVWDGIFNLKRYGKGNDITLTMDADVCKAAYEAMNGYNGVVGVMNYKTGEIICIVSTPTYDPLNKPSEEKEGMYLNKFFKGVYTPGSTFKIITLASALENIQGLENMTFDCEGNGKGQVQIGEGYVFCSGVHKNIMIEKAFNVSCNCAFAEISDTLGKEKLTATAEGAGFNRQMNKINGKITCNTSTLNLSEAKALDTAWAGIGQYTTLVNPCHLLTIVSSIANGGTVTEPYLVSKITSPAGKTVYSYTQRETDKYFSPAVAEELKKYMRSNVVNTYGDNRFSGLEMCGKTGTAEVSDAEGAKPNALFAGFSSNDDYPYAIVVVVEDSAKSITTAVPVASKVMAAVKKANS